MIAGPPGQVGQSRTYAAKAPKNIQDAYRHAEGCVTSFSIRQGKSRMECSFSFIVPAYVVPCVLKARQVI